MQLKAAFPMRAAASPRRVGRRGYGLSLTCAMCLFFSTSTPVYASPSRSPVNQIFQWSASGTSEGWPDGSRKDATAFLWIPEACLRLRGLLILGTNVPEHMLVAHESIREVCRKNNLGIVWAVPSFWNFSPGSKGHDGKQVEFLEELLRRLAEVSGYDDVAEVPWLPIGESGHLLMVCGLINQRPDKCIAGICVKNPHEPQNKTVPLLWTLGTAQEWGQAQKDIRTSWRDTGAYRQWCTNRSANGWPLSVVVEHGTGHFFCTDAMTGYFAEYITAAVRARLPDDGSPGMKAINLDRGVLANLPLERQTNLGVIPYAEATEEEKKRPWFFNGDLARAAQRLSEPGSATEAQLASIEPVTGCRTEPHALNSVTKLYVKSDGEFSVRPVLLDRIPDGFLGAGEPLSRSDGEPVAEWICGPFAPTDGGTFRIAADRTWTGRAAAYLIVKHEGDHRVRRTVQPVHVTIEKNDTGAAQTIAFDPIHDVPAHADTVELSARSDSGLPVSFFVNHGPAVVDGDTLKITPVPPGAKFPVEISVTAWQWGRATDPQVQTARPVTKTFRILPPVER